MTGALVYQNPAGLREFWWWSELYPMGKRIADAMTAQMLPAGNSVSFDATLPSSHRLRVGRARLRVRPLTRPPTLRRWRPAQGGNG